VASVTVGTEKQVTPIEAGTTAYDVVGDKARQVVVARVNGELVDLSHVLQDGDQVDAVLITEPEGLSVLRHSTAHIIAQAAQALFPEAKLGIGPPIKDGFFYDFGTETTFSPDDLAAIEKKQLKSLTQDRNSRGE